MAVELATRPFVPSAVSVPAPSPSPTAVPEDLAGTRFLHSIGWALLAAAWGAWLGAMVESAVEASVEARVGALIAATALVACGMLLAFYGSAKYGIKESLGLALMDALALSWQGAWLGALIGGGLTAANGGVWVIPAALGAVLVGGLIGLGVGLRLFGKNVPRILNGVVWGGVIAGFAASFLWTPSAALTFTAPVPESASRIFGPSADWAWRTAGALIGGLAQLGCVYLIAHVTLPPTPGTWMGAVGALFFWGLGRQPKC